MLVAVGVVDEHGVAVAERAAAGVLAGDAQVGALEEQRAVGHGLGQRPVDLAVGPQLVAGVELLAELGVDAEAVGDASSAWRRSGRGRARSTPVSTWRQHADGRGRRPALDLLVGRGLARLVERGLQPRLEVVERVFSASSRESWPRLTSDSVNSFRTERRSSILAYMSGCV